jgi:hypothetical protein
MNTVSIELRKQRIVHWLERMAVAEPGQRFNATRNWYAVAVRYYVNQCIDEGIGIYDQMSREGNDLVAELAGDDEIRAYVAATLLLEDMPELKLDEMTALVANVSKQVVSCQLIHLYNWSKLYMRFAEKLDELEEDLICPECQQVFNDRDAFNGHIYADYHFGEPDEERCFIENDDAYDEYKEKQYEEKSD